MDYAKILEKARINNKKYYRKSREQKSKSNRLDEILR